ncbi:MAG: potassium channel family protein [Gammaproteobacteria bacterium]|nr:potassium channel family protein [Gammaproteobacteria bacterium]
MRFKDFVSHVDEYGILNYKARYLTLLAFACLYGVITILAFVLLYFEQAAPGSNILSYKDAFWTLQMSASTIGFGDYYPVTMGGRIVVALMFYIGVGLVGFIGALIADKIIGFADTAVKNRELKRQNENLMLHNQVLEQKLDKLMHKLNSIIDDDKKW